jgi:hypothetical protein
LTFQTKTFDRTTGSDGEQVINGDTDLVITDASDHSSFRAIIELQQPSAVQTRARGQVFAEMLGLKCHHPPLHVGVLTDLFSLYVLLSTSTTPTGGVVDGVVEVHICTNSENRSVNTPTYSGRCGWRHFRPSISAKTSLVLASVLQMVATHYPVDLHNINGR